MSQSSFVMIPTDVRMGNCLTISLDWSHHSIECMISASVPGGARVNSVLDTLLALSRSLTGAKQGGLLADALDVLLAGVGCARGAAYTMTGDALELVGERGLPPAIRAPLARLSLGESPWFPAQKAALTRKVVVERDLGATGAGPLDRGALSRARWGQVLACPIYAGRDVYGALVLAWPADEETHEPALVVEIACNMLAVQMARHDDEQRRAESRDGAVRSARMVGLGILASGFAEEVGDRLADCERRLGEQQRPVDLAEALQLARKSTARFLSAVVPSAPERVDLGALTADVLALVAPHLRRHRVEIALRASGEHGIVGRRSELMQLFIQLVLGTAGVLDGADDVCSDRSVLIPRAFVLEVRREGGREVVSLSDAAEDGTAARASFFDIGAQLRDPGFDLSVARQIVIAHEGHIEIGPVEHGSGVRCTVVLPVAASEADRRAARGRLVAGARRVPDGPRPVVLWIDEDDLFLEIMVQSLPDLDIRVARSAAEGMQLLAFGVKPSLLLCNVRLADRAGHQVHAEIARQDPRLAERFAFITDGVLTPEMASYIIGCGRPALTRPIDLDQVRSLAQHDPAAPQRAAAMAPTLTDLRAERPPSEPAARLPTDPRNAPTVPAMRAAKTTDAPPTPATRGVPIEATTKPSTMRDQELAAIARVIAETLRREGPKRGALVSGMLRARGLSEPEALAVVTFALANRILVRDPAPSTILRVPDTDQRTVLVVDDDFDLRHTMREILQDEGFVVATAANGREALELLRRSNPPRVMVLDLMMPEMDGWQLLDELKRDEALADIPVVVISASKKGLQGSDAHEFLSKPLDYYRLITTLERTMKPRANA